MLFGSVCVCIYIIIVHVTEFVSSGKNTAVSQEKMSKSAYPSTIEDAYTTYFGAPFVKLISEALKYPNPPNERLPIRIARQRNKLGAVLTLSDDLSTTLNYGERAS